MDPSKISEDNQEYVMFKRNKWRQVFSTIVDDEKLGANIEVSVFNYAIKEATFRNVIKKWTEPDFCDLYNDRLRSIFINLKNNQNFVQSIKNGDIQPSQLSTIKHQEMKPEHWKEMIENKQKRDENRFNNNLQASTNQYKCRKCKSVKCYHFTLQTRSADEPETVFITCLDCGNNWTQ